MSSPHIFPHIWNLSDGYPAAGMTAHNSMVFSCFACGGGSSMGYKLAGYHVVGANDIDKQMAKIYKANHHPKHYYLMDIRELVKLDTLPDELFHLDVLDGSPPCSTFSMAGSREDAWGKAKVFREGQTAQVLDDLFFHFVELAKRLQPKVVIAENVSGLIKGNAKGYVLEICKAFRDAGYQVQVFLLNASRMGVPQRRERVFFIAQRNDIAVGKISMQFDEAGILFGSYRDEVGSIGTPLDMKLLKLRIKTDMTVGDINKRLYNKISRFNQYIISDTAIPNTITSTPHTYRHSDGMAFTDKDIIITGTFPLDYNFMNAGVHYVVGMSVPPVMMAQVANQVYQQILSKITTSLDTQEVADVTL